MASSIALLIKAVALSPISNKEVLDLVAKYKEIANYFFLPRRRPGDAQYEQVHAGIVINNSSGGSGCDSCPIKTAEQVIDSKLLQGFVQEKIQTCKAFVLEMQFDKLREEIDKIFVYDLSGILGADTLLFYKRILELYCRYLFGSKCITKRIFTNKISLCWS